MRQSDAIWLIFVHKKGDRHHDGPLRASIPCGLGLLQKHHLLRLRETSCVEFIEIDPARHGHAHFITAVPGDTVRARWLNGVGEPAHELPGNIIDREDNMRTRAGRVLDRCCRVEWIRVVLRERCARERADAGDWWY